MTVTLSTATAIAVVVVIGVVVAACLVIVALALAGGTLPGAEFDEHKAEADALAAAGFAEHTDQAIALTEQPTQPLTFVDGAPVGGERNATLIAFPFDDGR